MRHFQYFFSNIGPELAEKVNIDTNKNFDVYLKKTHPNNIFI